MARDSQEQAAGTVGSQRSAMIWFLVLLGVYLIAGVVLLEVDLFHDRIVDPWTRFNATASATLVNWVGIETNSVGTRVQFGSTALNIADGCNGAHALLILLSSVFAFPAPWGRRLLGALLGTLTVLGFNLIRLVNLIVVAHYFPARLELFHIYIWQTLIILIALAYFLLWGTFFAESRNGAREVSVT